MENRLEKFANLRSKTKTYGRRDLFKLGIATAAGYFLSNIDTQRSSAQTPVPVNCEFTLAANEDDVNFMQTNRQTVTFNISDPVKDRKIKDWSLPAENPVTISSESNVLVNGRPGLRFALTEPSPPAVSRTYENICGQPMRIDLLRVGPSGTGGVATVTPEGRNIVNNQDTSDWRVPAAILVGSGIIGLCLLGVAAALRSRWRRGENVVIEEKTPIRIDRDETIRSSPLIEDTREVPPVTEVKREETKVTTTEAPSEPLETYEYVTGHKESRTEETKVKDEPSTTVREEKVIREEKVETDDNLLNRLRRNAGNIFRREEHLKEEPETHEKDTSERVVEERKEKVVTEPGTPAEETVIKREERVEETISESPKIDRTRNELKEEISQVEAEAAEKVTVRPRTRVVIEARKSSRNRRNRTGSIQEESKVETTGEASAGTPVVSKVLDDTVGPQSINIHRVEGLIRHEHTGEVSLRYLPITDVDKIEHERRRILEQAELEAERIRKETEQEIDQMMEELNNLSQRIRQKTRKSKQEDTANGL